MTRIFGHFIARQDDQGEYLKIGFSPTSIPMQQRWRNNGLSADFLADYLSTFFAGDNHAAAERQAKLKSTINYVVNELLENAMKFSYAPAQHAIGLAMHLEPDAVSLYVTNSVDPHAVESFQQIIARLLSRVGRERGRLSRLFSRPPSKPDVRLSPHPALQFPLFPSPGSTPWPGIMFRIVSALRISRTFASFP
jgi:hypothetical protein